MEGSRALRRLLGIGGSLGAALVLLAACESGGSDIGPRLDRVPDASFRVQVLDDQNRGVSGATVMVAGVAIAATGRSGRVDLFAAPGGVRDIVVSGATGSAAAGDLLGTLSWRETLFGGERSAPVHLPDLSASAGLAITAGVQGAPLVLDDSGTSGAVVTIPAGTSVSAGGLTTFRLRTGSVQAGHVPGSLPAAAGGVWLLGRGLYLDPAASFAPGVDLVGPNDLLAPNGSPVALLFLDPAVGSWVQVGLGAASGASLTATGLIAQGGLFAFAVEVPAAATVTGRIVDEAGQPLPGALLRGDATLGRSAGDGRFTLAGLAGTMADGSARSATLEVRGGRDYLPAGTSAVAALVANGSVDVGDVALATVRAGDIRVQQVVRGRAAVQRRCAVGSLDGRIARLGISDDRGQCFFDEVPADWFGFTLGYPVNEVEVQAMDVVGFLERGRARLDIFQFFGRQFWFVGGRNTRARVMDSVAGGPLRGAVITGSTAGAGFVQVAQESGVLIVGRPFDGRANAAITTVADGQTVTAAFSIQRPNGEHLELPLLQAERQPLGAFDGHGLANGNLTNANPASEHRLRVTRRLVTGDWFDEVLLGVPMRSSLPVKVDPAAGGTVYRAGVAFPRGNLAAVEGTTTLGTFTLDKVGLRLGQAATGGTEQSLDIALDLTANTAFAAPGAGGGLDPALPAASLTFDLALQLPDGTVADVVRAVGGNAAVAGADVTFTLPALTGALQGHQWWLAYGGSVASAPGTISQRTLSRLAPPGSITPPFLPVPAITAPADGATVSSGGFTVSYSVPAGTLYMTMELRSTSPSDTLHWLAVVPPNLSSYDFVQLPAQSPTPLVAGRSYSLTVAAHRADTGPLLRSSDPYRDLTTFWHAIDTEQRGVTAISSRTITVTLN